jgi:hypothetical protein
MSPGSSDAAGGVPVVPNADSAGSPQGQPLSLTGYHGAPTEARLLIESFDAGQRMRRAVKGLAGFWGAMVVSVFIPIAHFVLVPSLFAIGIWQFVRRLHLHQVVRGAHGACPDCGAEQDFELSAARRFPQGVQCRACHRGLTLTAD